MSRNLAKLIPVCPELEKIAPNNINHPLLLEVADQIAEDARCVFPEKRSGFTYETLFYADLYAQMTHLSPKKSCSDLKTLWKGKEKYFQRFNKRVFVNGKHRQAIPDQPTMSRFLQKIADSGFSQDFGNLLLWAQFLYIRKEEQLYDDLTLIADYNDERCQKDKTDDYCFGTKEGKTVHRTLTFSIISGEFHLVIATFKIKKQQSILPLFQEIMAKFQTSNIIIKYCLLDRGFYRKDLLPALKEWQITTILPGRNCKDTRQKIRLWIQDKSGRSGTVVLKVKYVKKAGWIPLRMDVVLVGKRGHTLDKVKRDLYDHNISESDAAKRVFPLLVIKGNPKGLKVIRGNENYIRSLYRERWAIEIAFRETHLIGIGNWFQNRDKRLYHFNLKCFIYNLWQISKVRLSHENPEAEPLTLDEFCGRLVTNRTIAVT